MSLTRWLAEQKGQRWQAFLTFVQQSGDLLRDQLPADRNHFTIVETHFVRKDQSISRKKLRLTSVPEWIALLRCLVSSWLSTSQARMSRHISGMTASPTEPRGQPQRKKPKKSGRAVRVDENYAISSAERLGSNPNHIALDEVVRVLLHLPAYTLHVQAADADCDDGTLAMQHSFAGFSTEATQRLRCRMSTVLVPIQQHLSNVDDVYSYMISADKLKEVLQHLHDYFSKRYSHVTLRPIETALSLIRHRHAIRRATQQPFWFGTSMQRNVEGISPNT